MNNKQEWEEEFDKKFIYQFGDGTRNVNWSHEMENKVKDFISQREAEIRKEAIEDYLKSEEGKVYQDYQTMKKQAENDVRKETIKAVLPCKVKTTIGKESKYFKEQGFDRNNFATGHNQCRQSIIDKAKEKFNITI